MDRHNHDHDPADRHSIRAFDQLAGSRRHRIGVDGLDCRNGNSGGNRRHCRHMFVQKPVDDAVHHSKMESAGGIRRQILLRA